MQVQVRKEHVVGEHLPPPKKGCHWGRGARVGEIFAWVKTIIVTVTTEKKDDLAS